jgi:hypothetical protein
MLAGHLAVALAAKRAEPRLPLAATVTAAFALDFLWPLLLLLGVETVSVHAHDTAFTNLSFDSYPWSHSLLAVAGWSLLGGAIAKGVGATTRAAMLIGALVMSHWLLDLVTHRPDLPLWPGGPLAGLALWNSVAGTIVVEGGLLVGGLWLYLQSTTAKDGTGRWALVGLVLLIGLMWVTQPWSPPPPSPTAVAWGSLTLWLLPLWARWIEHHRQTTREEMTR